MPPSTSSASFLNPKLLLKTKFDNLKDLYLGFPPLFKVSALTPRHTTLSYHVALYLMARSDWIKEEASRPMFLGVRKQ